MRRNVVIILHSHVAAVGAACGGSSYGNNNNGPSFTPVPSGPNTVLAPNGAYLGNGTNFTPGTLTVPAGTTVTWGNNDVTTHTVTSDTARVQLEQPELRRDVPGEVRQPGAVQVPLHHSLVHDRDDRRAVVGQSEAARPGTLRPVARDRA